MEQQKTLEGDGFRLTLYPKEIPARGEAFLAVEKCAPSAWDNALAQGVQMLRDAGARRVLATSRTGESPFVGARVHIGALVFRFRHAMDLLELPLRDWKPGEVPRRLTQEPLTRENAPAFIDLYNQAMAQVPNIATQGLDRLEELLAPDRRGFLFRLEEVPAALVELDRSGGIPLVDALAVAAPLRGMGLGREALETVLELLKEERCPQVRLLVSTANPQAYRLYRQMGFQKLKTYSAWYEVE